jgi:hypothetical protein
MRSSPVGGDKSASSEVTYPRLRVGAFIFFSSSKALVHLGLNPEAAIRFWQVIYTVYVYETS